jgi:DNA-binding NarL/FixJ family response regulator
VLLEDEPAFAHCFGEIHAFLEAHDPAPRSTPAFPALTPRERELVELLAHGLDNLQIAAHLGLTEKTVRNKVSAVFDKLDVATRAQAIVQARQAGFGAAPLPR